jgi:hypothetical protein
MHDRIVCLILVLALAVSGCGKNRSESDGASQPDQSVSRQSEVNEGDVKPEIDRQTDDEMPATNRLNR